MRMYCIYSREGIKKMGGNRGKLAAMAGHAYLHAFWDAEKRFPLKEDYWGYIYPDWYNYKYAPKARKIALVVETDAELEAIYEQYVGKIGTTKVVDSGLTVFDGPTLACIGLGPCKQLDIPLSRVLI
jgi:peptidyl-tRNA hydrolase